MTDMGRTVAAVPIRTDGPTTVSFKALHAWVIWQLPRRKGGGLSGAVRPPIANHGWFPAIVVGDRREVLVYGHLGEEFDSPIAAADWLDAANSA